MTAMPWFLDPEIQISTGANPKGTHSNLSYTNNIGAGFVRLGGGQAHCAILFDDVGAIIYGREVPWCVTSGIRFDFLASPKRITQIRCHAVSLPEPYQTLVHLFLLALTLQPYFRALNSLLTRIPAMTRIFTLTVFGLAIAVPANLYGQPQNPAQGQAAQAQARADAANQAIFGRINQNAFYMDPAIQAQLNVNAQQAQLLNQQQAQLWSVYLKTQSQFNPAANLTDAQRIALLQAGNQYYTNLNSATANILSPDQRTRFWQLSLQYRGYEALWDPYVSQQLALTNDQMAKIQQYRAAYDLQLAKVYQLRQSDPKEFASQLGQLRSKMTSQINGVLTQDQQQKWQGFIGTTHNFNYLY